MAFTAPTKYFNIIRSVLLSGKVRREVIQL